MYVPPSIGAKTSILAFFGYKAQKLCQQVLLSEQSGPRRLSTGAPFGDQVLVNYRFLLPRGEIGFQTIPDRMHVP